MPDNGNTPLLDALLAASEEPTLTLELTLPQARELLSKLPESTVKCPILGQVMRQFFKGYKGLVDKQKENLL